MRKFGRLPKCIHKRTSAAAKAEYNLFKRWERHKKLISEDTQQELRALGAHTVASGAVQPAVLSDAVQRFIRDVRKFGRLPKRRKDKRTSADEKAENNLYVRWRRHEKSIPENTKQELQALGEKGVGDTSQPIGDLMQQIQDLGRLPKRARSVSEYSGAVQPAVHPRGTS